MSETQVDRREAGEDRRARPPEHDRRQAQNDHPLNLLLTKVSHDVTLLSSDVRDLNGKLANHMKDETLELAEAVASLMIKSFAGGDPSVHKAWHEAQIQEALEKAEAAKAKKEFWSKLLFELAKFGLLGFTGWVVITLWRGLLIGPSK